MDKLCAFLKKHNGVIGIVVYALLAVYALCMATPAAPCRYYDDTIDFYYGLMWANDLLIYLSIAGIVWSVLYTTLRNQIRKVYYISNFVWHGVYVVLGLVTGIMTIVCVSTYQSQFMALPFDDMNEWFVLAGTSSINSETPIFILGYLEAALIVISCVPVAIVGVRQALARFKKAPNADQSTLPEASEQ